MSINQCRIIREEIDHASAADPVGGRVAGHLQICDQCRAFHAEQNSLRALMANLGTVAAPADFDFKLKARLAREKSADANSGFLTGLLRRPGALAVAALVLVAATGAVLIKNWLSISPPPDRTAVVQPGNPPEVKTTNPIVSPDKAATLNQENGAVAKNPNLENQPPKAGTGNRPANSYGVLASRKHPSVASRDLALDSAPVFISGQSEAAGPIVRIPIDDEALRISIDDGQGKPRMVSLPTVSFGSQRLTSSNSFVPVSTQKGIW